MWSITKSTRSVWLSLIVAAAVWASQAQAERTSRQVANCAAGTICIPLNICPQLLQLLRNPTAENIQTLRSSVCGFSRRIPRVCCGTSQPTQPTRPTQPTLNTSPTPPTRPVTQPTQPTRPTQPTQPTRPTEPTGPVAGGGEALLPAQCGITSSVVNRIFFGENAPMGAYPWMALMGYNTRFQPEHVFGCGGALITTRYVLTASHCTQRQFTNNRDLSLIRLGEHNIQTEQDCTTSGSNQICAPAAQDFSPAQVILHPDFNTRGSVTDDIALIRLDRDATLNEYVQPICLPSPGLVVSDFLGNREVTVAGWGTTERGPDTQILQRVNIPYVSKDECNPHYDNVLVPEQICFGGSGQRDACFGDSGGPVFANNLANGRFTLLAVVSFGQPDCGVPGVPAVYTSVPDYRTWIINNLRP